MAMALAMAVLVAACGGSDKAGDKSSKPQTANLYASLDAKPFVAPLVVAFEKANPGFKAKVTYVAGPKLAATAATAKADIVITSGIAMRLVEKQMKSKTAPIVLGWDELVIAVARGNPKKITTVAAFAADSPTTSVACLPKTVCGKWTERVLKNAGITPAATRPNALPAQILNDIATQRVDAAMLQRPTVVLRAGKVQQVPIPPKENVRLVYQAEVFNSGSAAVRFATFAKSKQAKVVMTARGYLPATMVLKPKGTPGTVPTTKG